MDNQKYFSLIKTRKQTIFTIVILFLILSSILTFSQSLKYGAKSKLLVVQNYSVGTDPYAISRSNEYLSNILTQVVYSNSFFTEVLGSGFGISKDYFGSDTRKQMKKWEKTISARAINDTGIITIDVYHPDQYQAGQIAQAINYILKTKNKFYHGGGSQVEVKIIDQPIISRFPIKPNIVLNFSLAFVFGIIFGLLYIYLLPGEKYSIDLLPSFKSGKLKEPIDGNESDFDDRVEYEEDNNEGGYSDIEQEIEDDIEIEDKGDIKNIFGSQSSGN